MSFTTLDIILLACFIPALIQGLRKGFTGQLIGIATLIAGAYLAFRFSSSVSNSFAPSFPNVDIRVLRVLSFLLIFTVIAILLWLLGKLLGKLIDITTLGWLNRIFGMLFSVFTTALILALVFSLVDGVNDTVAVISPDTLKGSRVYGMIKDFSAKVFPYLETFFKNANV